MNAPIVGGAVLVLLGLLGLAVPFVSTQQTEEVARIGDLKLQTTENKTFAISPLVSGGVLALGIVVLGAGIIRKS